MLQWIKCLPGKPEDWSSNPRAHVTPKVLTWTENILRFIECYLPSILVNDYNLFTVFMIIMGNTAFLYMWGNWVSKVDKMVKAILLIMALTYLTWDKKLHTKTIYLLSVQFSVCVHVHVHVCMYSYNLLYNLVLSQRPFLIYT